MRPLPSPLQIIKVDYLASLGAIIPIVLWGMALLMHLFNAEAAPFFLAVAPITTAAALVLLFWRVQFIRSVFEYGIEVPGVIVVAEFFRGRGRLEYVYTFQSQKYQSGNAVQAVKLVRSKEPGQGVVIMVDRNRPKRAFLRDIYL